ncbi:hypothetical protein U9M48_032363 [Paspalum notatum var. saurae]|uniref:Uncharacterized protein n=1 Tax=Paspalum notatum var. saurae TaxID=547442 RepID=A0AAQ3U752_PASNO
MASSSLPFSPVLTTASWRPPSCCAAVLVAFSAPGTPSLLQPPPSLILEAFCCNLWWCSAQLPAVAAGLCNCCCPVALFCCTDA